MNAGTEVRQPHQLFCWISGWTGNYRPQNYHGPTELQMAHIASGSGKARRVDSVKAVVLLSPICHLCHVSNSDAFHSTWIAGREWPTIDERHTLWCKRMFDSANYDPDFLATIWIGKVPDPVPPPTFWRELMFKSQGLMT